ncbi:MAG: DUF2726 domain-containing protein, partial [Steroidobacteraceae bacterium]
LMLAVVAVAALRRKALSDEREWPVVAAPVLSKAEQVMYHRLIKAFPDQRILAQVALSQSLRVQKGVNFYKVFNRYNRLTADFVICTADFRALAVLELDDRSHDRPRRLAADDRKGGVLHAAGIPLHRLNVNPMPGEAELRELLAK